MSEIPDSIKNNVRAVLLSKTDGSGVLVSTFLRDYKAFIKETLMFKSLGYSTLQDFVKGIPDVCRLDYSEKDMAYKLFGIAKPNMYMSSFMKKAAEGSDEPEDERRRSRGGRRNRENRERNNHLDEDWIPSSRGFYSVVYPNVPGNGLETREQIAVLFSKIGEVAEINIIPQFTFVRYKDQEAAKTAIRIWNKEYGVRKADEKKKDNNSASSVRNPTHSSNKPDQHMFQKEDNNDHASRGPDRHRENQSSGERDQNNTGSKPNWGRPQQNTENQASYNQDHHRENQSSAEGDQKQFGGQNRGQNPGMKKDNKTQGENERAPFHSPVSDEIIQVYVGNWPWNASLSELQQLVNQYDNKGYKIKSAKDSKTKQYAFVDFLCLDEAERMVNDLDKYMLHERCLQVRLASAGKEMEKMKAAHQRGNQTNGAISKQNQLNNRQGHNLSPESNTNGPNYNNYIKKEPKSPNNNYVKNEPRSPNNNYVKNEQRSPIYNHSSSSQSPNKMPSLETVGSPEMPRLERTGPYSQRGRKGLLGDMPKLEPMPTFGSVPGQKGLLGDYPRTNTDNDDDMPELESLDITGPPVQQPSEQGVQLNVGNFTYGTREEELYALMAPYGVQNIVVMNTEVKTRSTYAFATFANYPMAQQAMLDLDQHMFKGRRLVVTMSNPMAYHNLNQSKPINQPANPLARITCTVGEDLSRTVSLQDTSLSQISPIPSNISTVSHNSHTHNYDNARGDASRREYKGAVYSRSIDTFNFKRLTLTLREYAMIVNKLRAEEDFTAPVGTTMKIQVTHVENDKFFWGQIIEDTDRGFWTNLEALHNISQNLQDPSTRQKQSRSLGRCTSCFEGTWYRAWCTFSKVTNGVDMCEVFYLDYGNTATVPRDQVFMTTNDVWNVAMVAKPFKFTDLYLGLEKLVGKVIEVEVVEVGSCKNNYMTIVQVLQ